MTEDAPAAAPQNRAARRAGKTGAPKAPGVTSRAGMAAAERLASARTNAMSKPQLRK